METVDNQVKPISMPVRIREWLNARGISDALIEEYGIGYDGRIIIPIRGFDGQVLFRKFRRDPEILTGPKYTYEKGATTAIFPVKHLKNAGKIIICEGEFDAILLQSKGFYAVTSTGGALSFKEEWAQYFVEKEVFICFDNDKAGLQGILKVARMIPHAKILPLPAEAGEHGDITDFFIKLGKTPENLKSLMSVATALPLKKEEVTKLKKRSKPTGNTDLEKAKSIPLTTFLKFNVAGFASCPLHGRDSEPSFKLYPNNRWHCFGCGKGGDTIDFIVWRDNLSLKDAIRKLIG
jgi:hypothetical protein